MNLGQVFTKSIVADYMVSLFQLDKTSLILDPCFGRGAFFTALKNNGFNNFHGYEIDKKLFSQTEKEWPDKKLFNVDFLLNSSQILYDGIIMNPPYIRHELINDLIDIGVSKSQLQKEVLYKELPSTANLYMYFIVKALSMLRDEGEMIVIFPSSWLNSLNGKKFKKILKTKSKIINEIHLRGELFEEKALVQVFILHLKKTKNDIPSNHKSYILYNNKYKKVTEYRNSIELGFNITFNELASIRRGLTTGYNEMYINPNFSEKSSRKHCQNIISSPKSVQGYNTENVKKDVIFLPNNSFEFSEEIINYLEKYRNIIITSEKPKTLYNKITRNNKKWYEIKSIDSGGIIFNYFVRADMKFIMNEEYLVRDNFYIIKPKIDNVIMFALLNNYYTYFQLENLGKKYGAGLLKLQKYDLEKLLFPNINKFSTEDISLIKIASEKLMETSDISEVDTITKIIAKYADVSFNEIHSELMNVKNNRLKGEKNENK